MAQQRKMTSAEAKAQLDSENKKLAQLEADETEALLAEATCEEPAEVRADDIAEQIAETKASIRKLQKLHHALAEQEQEALEDARQAAEDAARATLPGKVKALLREQQKLLQTAEVVRQQVDRYLSAKVDLEGSIKTAGLSFHLTDKNVLLGQYERLFREAVNRTYPHTANDLQDQAESLAYSLADGPKPRKMIEREREQEQQREAEQAQREREQREREHGRVVQQWRYPDGSIKEQIISPCARYPGGTTLRFAPGEKVEG